ncbi:MAG TPA: carboxypeptidase-like regulatory domain-containing protein, partial [Bacteroidales bacterium]|nr:carboxypeptidase-like regulatory domain-containing protein [Bacteroidales bacterium]
NGRNAYYSIISGYKQKQIFHIDLQKCGNISPYTLSGMLSISDSTEAAGRVLSVRIVSQVTGDTLYKSVTDESGKYSLNVSPGLFRIVYSGRGYIPQVVDTVFPQNSPDLLMKIDVLLQKDLTAAGNGKFEKIDLTNIPLVSKLDSAILIKNLVVKDEGDKTMKDADVLYYTVQVIALHRPVDVSYFKYIGDLKVLYNENDKFYRYTTGRFEKKEEAHLHRLDLIKKGYTEEIFIKKVSN